MAYVIIRCTHVKGNDGQIMMICVNVFKTLNGEFK